MEGIQFLHASIDRKDAHEQGVCQAIGDSGKPVLFG